MGYTYIISDIHGQLECFESILRQIDLQPDDKLYVLGDVIDRGAHGIAILKKIMNMPNVEMLLGNHEFMMLNALGAPYDGISRNICRSFELWYSNGGSLTHFAWCCLPYSQQLELIDYLKSCPLNIDIELNGKKHRLVHAADRKFYSSYKIKIPKFIRLPTQQSRYFQKSVLITTTTQKRILSSPLQLH